VLKEKWQVTRWPVLMLVAVAFGMGPATLCAGTNVWTSLGPEGGSIQSLVIDPQNSNTVYALASGAIFKSADATANWRQIYPSASSDGTTTYLVSVLAIDPQNTNTLYAGTAGSPTTVDGGVFKSTDGGATWSAANSGLPSPSDGTYRVAQALAVDPQNPGTAYVGFVIQCVPVIPVPCTSGGVFKTTDGGASWSNSNFGFPGYGVTALLIDPHNTKTIYAGTVANPVPPGPLESDGGKGIPITNDGGIFKSTDGAATWIAVNSGLPRSHWYDRPTQFNPINALAIDPQDSSMLYAATGAGGIAETNDGGVTWTAGKNGLSVSSLAIDPQDPNTIYTGTANFGLLKSTDRGASFDNVSSGVPTGYGPGGVSFLAMDPQTSTLYSGSHLYVGGVDLGGTFQSSDGAMSWSPVNTSGIAATSINSLAVDPENAGTLFAATNGLVFNSTDNGGHWNETYSAPPTVDGRSVYPASVVAIDPQDSSTIYVAIGDNSDGGGGIFKSDDGGATWTRHQLPIGGGVRGMAVEPLDSETLYAWTNMGIVKSVDGGANWFEIAGSKEKSAGAPSWCFDFPGSVAIAPGDPNTIYAGTCPTGGGLFKSTDGGQSWTTLTVDWSVVGINPEVPLPPVIFGSPSNPLNSFQTVAVDPQNAGTVYVWTIAAGLLKTTDGGASWNAVNSGLPVSGNGIYSGLNGLAIDPQNSSNVYAATTGGVFKSADGGTSWAAVNAGLTNLSVNTLNIDPHDSNTVYAGTAGGVFVITFAP